MRKLSICFLTVLFLLNVFCTEVFCEKYKDGKYKGISTGYVGPVEVEVKIKSGKISQVKVINHAENIPGTSIKDIPERIIKAQNTKDVDTVSGATITSKAILRGVTEALKKASKKSEKPKKKPLKKIETVMEGSIVLPDPDLTKGMPLMKCLKNRKTSRSFKKKELTFDIISELLWAANGINRIDNGKRTAPSAMNSQEIDIYVALKRGLYKYNHKKHLLSPVLNKDIRELTGYQKFTQIAPVNLIYVANLNKLTGGDGTMKEFYAATDTGFICQNVYLYCASEGLSTVVLGWVDRKKLEKVMKLPKNKKVTLVQPVGFPE